MPKRNKTRYAGVFYMETRRTGGQGTEKVYYIVFKKNGVLHEEVAGRQYRDGMTEARAALIRGERIEGKRKSRKTMREEAEAKKQMEADRWTINRLWEHYTANREMRGIDTDTSRYNLHIKPTLEKKSLAIYHLSRSTK